MKKNYGLYLQLLRIHTTKQVAKKAIYHKTGPLQYFFQHKGIFVFIYCYFCGLNPK